MATTAGSVGRISGVAVALGIGAAVATGLAASAWAAPEEQDGAGDRTSRAAAAADRSATGSPGDPAARSAGRTVAAGPARRAASASAIAAPAEVSVAALPPRASAAVAASALPARRAVAAPVVAVPAAVVAPQPAPGTPAPGTPPAGQLRVAPAASAPVAARRSAKQRSLWPDSRGRLITIYKRTHFAIPNNFGFFVRTVTGTGTFTTNSAYDLGDEDQFDWNKFTGIAFTPLEPDRNSVMVGWRYNLNNQQFEVAPFYNVDKKRILPNENPSSPGYEVISVPVGETFNFHVDYTGVTLSYGDRTVFKPFPEGLTPNVWTAARVSGWFGGNEVAPRTISYFIKFA